MTTQDYLDQLESDRSDMVDNLETQGITGLTGDETFTELVPEILNIAGGESPEAIKKDVNFYDYDGKRLYSYTKSEFLSLTEMPSNPEHDTLVSQGWNYSLADAKAYLESYSRLNIGQMYNTTDGWTRFYIYLDDGGLSPTLGFAINGTAKIDWGDGSSVESATGSSTSTVITRTHTYSAPGQYIIKLTSLNNKVIQLKGSSTLSQVFSRPYLDRLYKVEFGDNIQISNYAFSHAYGLRYITLPNTMTRSIGQYSFYYCPGIEHIVLPYGLTLIGYGCFSYCYGLRRVVFSNTMVGEAIGIQCFQYCYSLQDITFPSTITVGSSYTYQYCYAMTSFEIPGTWSLFGNGCFDSCQYVEYYDFSRHTSVPTLRGAIFTSNTQNFKVIVPDSLYEDWKVAEYWSSYTSNIIKKSDWDAL